MVAGEGDGRTSLLDRVPIDRFLLLVGPEGAAWIEALASVQEPQISALRLTPALLRNLTHWLGVAGIGSSGALLVRPDQHVAWRSPKLVANPGEELAGAMRLILDPSSG